tara:strand:+ start:882 stop:2540 length:1659 start_codon:yes stop_codon:yes gene_type:complete
MSDFKQTPYPGIAEYTKEEMVALAEQRGSAALLHEIQKRERVIQLAKDDPLEYGVKLDPWKDADRLLETYDELLILGGNRSGKTEYAARTVANKMAHNDSTNTWCLHTTLPSSIEMQQPVVRRYLPPQWRNIGKQGQTTNVRWTDKAGFADQVFILPNSSRTRFLNYSMDEKVFEGGELDMIWADELIGYELVKTLRYRIVTRSGKLIITFTPVRGYTMTVKEYLAGARVVESRPAELLDQDNIHVPGCKPGEMPYILEARSRSAAIICFHSLWNPFGGYENIVKMLDGKTTEEIKIRAYGWAERLEGKAFPRFIENVHVVKPEDVPTKGTRYCSCDPGGTKNWFIKWYIIDDLDRVFLYREWPDRKTYGEWAFPSDKPDGKPGPAQTPLGMSILSYKKLLKKLEGDEEIFERVIDPRGGGAEVPNLKQGQSIISMMDEEQQDAEGNVVGESVIWHAGPGGDIEDGITVINDMFDYDATSEVSAMNHPKFFISSDCEQSIYAYSEYTGLDGLKGALKDCIDPDRYLFKRGIYYVDENTMQATGGFTAPARFG